MKRSEETARVIKIADPGTVPAVAVTSTAAAVVIWMFSYFMLSSMFVVVAPILFRMATGGGYTVAGDFRYFDSTHQFVPDAKVDTSALKAVGKALNAKQYSEIADAHSATDSYLPCFSPQ